MNLLKLRTFAISTVLVLIVISGTVLAVVTTTLGAPIPISVLLVSAATALLVKLKFRQTTKVDGTRRIVPASLPRRRAILKCVVIDESLTRSGENHERVLQ